MFVVREGGEVLLRGGEVCLRELLEDLRELCQPLCTITMGSVVGKAWN